MKKLKLIAVCVLASASLFAQKKPLDHSVYDSWNGVSGLSVPNNGDVALYSVNPQEGDGVLHIRNVRTNKIISVPRGYNAKLNKESNKVVALIKPLFSQTRNAKIKKVKKDDMPKDSLAIVDLVTGDIQKYPYCKSFKTSSKPGNFIAFELGLDKEKKNEPKDTLSGNEPKDTVSVKKKEIKAPAKEVKQLLVLNLANYAMDTLKNFEAYAFDQEGTYLAYTTKPAKGDSVTVTGLYLYNPVTRENRLVLSGPKESTFKLPVFSKANQMAFYANTDTTKAAKKDINIYLYQIAAKQLDLAVNNKTAGIPDTWIVSENGSLSFSENGGRLFFGTAPKPLEKDTTLVDFEQPTLDIWSWDADYNQPMQLLSRNRDLKQTYMAYVQTTLNSPAVQLGTLDAPFVSVPDKGMADYSIAVNDKKYRIQSQWSSDPAVDIYSMNIKDGSQKLLLENSGILGASFSPDGTYVVGYDSRQRQWVLLNVLTGVITDLTKDLGVAFYDESHDTPSEPYPYGQAIWFEDGKSLIIPDKYDYWKFDVTGKTAPSLLTQGYGRANEVELRFNQLFEYSEPTSFIKTTDPLYFQTLNKITKETGLAMLDIAKKGAKVTPLVQGPYTYAQVNLSMDAKRKKPVYIYTRANFEKGNNVWMTADNFKTQQQVSEINPQQDEYNWGTAELVKWKTADGIDCEGILYKPEDFDATKKYPVMIYFYEKNSDGLYASKSPAPSRSTVNIPYFVSNGYIVFVPDIYYKDGHPGQSAMRSIMPGVEMLEKFPWIDGKNMAIQGQSWGGYQVAYMITQTDKFKAAGAGAPVANMTSAYGGIRWGSGAVRQFQYEDTQSRIGKTLWDGFDLYVENSPLFFLPNVKTPVLIMHNDKDGAVPWYQGIELFTGLRRLSKVAWLLQYNDEDHNLVERRNAKDLSIRLSQFFDHYLKGAPMPEWMKEGRPAVKKGFDLGYELTKN